MSDLSATQCGCQSHNNGGSCSWIWIILILWFLCNCCGDNDCDSTSGRGGCFGNFLNMGDNSCCEWIIILIVLFCCCGNNGGGSLCC